jgi:nucleotide-binding universal stress UspA family protein
MYRILVPVDGSDEALRALEHAVRVARLIGEAEIHLINVQPPISGSVGTFVGNENVARFHQEESDNALAAARKLLEREGMAGTRRCASAAPASRSPTMRRKYRATRSSWAPAASAPSAAWCWARSPPRWCISPRSRSP